ncbi:lipoate--protein ligase family protein [bacterium]|nr:lipoate--protein ligase family protein [bacterium]
MGNRWKLILSPGRNGFFHMALDEMLIGIAEETGETFLRFYTWEPPCVSVGMFQDTAGLDIPKILSLGYQVVRRPTGGRAVLHKDEITYSIIFPPEHPITTLSTIESYRLISKALINGLISIGVPAQLSRGRSGYERNVSCFASTSRHEITLFGRKLVGSAQRRTHKTLLQHGSILTDYDKRAWKSIRAGKRYPSTIKEALGYIPPFEKTARALAKGFKELFDAELEPVSDTNFLSQKLKKLIEEKRKLFSEIQQ